MEELEITEKDFMKLPQKQMSLIIYKNVKSVKDDQLKINNTAQKAKAIAIKAAMIAGAALALTVILLGVILK